MGKQLSEDVGCVVHHIGHVTEGHGLRATHHGREVQLEARGYDHFA
jgi:thiamine monophosphate kinase